MRRILFLAVLALAGAAGTASAVPSYTYETDLVSTNGGTVTANAGVTLQANVYLVENGATAGTFSIKNENGLNSGAFYMQVVGTGLSRIDGDNSSANTSPPGSNSTAFAGPVIYDSVDNPSVTGPIKDIAVLAAVSPGQSTQTKGQGRPPLPDGVSNLNGKILLGTIFIVVNGPAGSDTLFKLADAQAFSTAHPAFADATTTNQPPSPNNVVLNKSNFGGFSFIGTDQQAAAGGFQFHVHVTGVPEPGSMALCTLAFTGMGFGAYRRYKAKKAAKAAEATEEVVKA